jgi:hypothetical protein
MPEKKTIERSRKDRRQGKSPSTQAGEFVREEIHHVREGKHGARSTRQAIAIALQKARKAGVHLEPPPAGKAKAKTRAGARRAYRQGLSGRRARPATKRSQGALRALRREGQAAASKESMARQAHAAADRRSASARRAAARKAARTKGENGRAAAARKAARTRGASRS